MSISTQAISQTYRQASSMNPGEGINCKEADNEVNVLSRRSGENFTTAGNAGGDGGVELRAREHASATK
jgi:hypothetical protein